VFVYDFVAPACRRQKIPVCRQAGARIFVSLS
jgi:hypothetical protein